MLASTETLPAKPGWKVLNSKDKNEKGEKVYDRGLSVKAL